MLFSIVSKKFSSKALKVWFPENRGISASTDREFKIEQT
jgi:hypothetical protein